MKKFKRLHKLAAVFMALFLISLIFTLLMVFENGWMMSVAENIVYAFGYDATEVDYVMKGAQLFAVLSGIFGLAAGILYHFTFKQAKTLVFKSKSLASGTASVIVGNTKSAAKARAKAAKLAAKAAKKAAKKAAAAAKAAASSTTTSDTDSTATTSTTATAAKTTTASTASTTPVIKKNLSAAEKMIDELRSK